MNFRRTDGRSNDEVRPLEILTDYTLYPEGSVLVSTGNTKIICTASVEKKVPDWLLGDKKSGNQGWVTSEYRMLPSATGIRRRRNNFNLDGRTQEIQRLIGRSLRAVVDLSLLLGHTIWIDCDVIQADGGTRTASINAAWIALKDTFDKLIDNKKIKENPLVGQIAAVSVGIVNKEVILDLDYSQDSEADVDLNVVMTSDSEFIEIQGTGERKSFTQKELDQMIRIASVGIDEILDRQMKEFS